MRSWHTARKVAASVGTSSSSSIRIPSITCEGLSVLIVDDEPGTLELLATLLEQLGARVVTADNVDDAIRLYTEHRPDVVVSDLAMPGRDGFQLMRMLRARSPQGLVPAVALSGRASADDRARALLAGFQCHLAKPATAVDLLLAIETARDSIAREVRVQ